MKVSIPDVLSKLAKRRPLFHSEADFQHEFAWEIRSGFKEISIRLEYPMRPGALDILLRAGMDEYAIELKYLRRRFDVDFEGEKYSLVAHGAQDQRRYDVWKDVARIERFVSNRERRAGSVVVLTNDPAYWDGPRREAGMGYAFSLQEDRSASGQLDWAPHTTAGTKSSRTSPISLRQAYCARWHGYGRLGQFSHDFRYLHFEIGKLSDEPVLPN